MKHLGMMLSGIMVMLCALFGINAANAAIDNTAYGILAFSQDQSSMTNSIVSFDLVSEKEPVFKRAVSFGELSTAGAFGAGYYYMAGSEVAGTSEVANALYKFDLKAGTYEKVGALSGFANIINDMAYDWSTSTMYAISRVDQSKSALFKIDLTNASAVKVADLDRKFFTLACDYGGQLYAISFEGLFCRISKDGVVTEVGNTGHFPDKFQSMDFDHGDRRLWWIASTRVLNDTGTIEVPESFVATIDVATGAVTRHQEFGDNQLAGLYIPSFAAPDNCPAQATGVIVAPAPNGESKATIAWTNPSTTFGGETLKSISKVEIARDGEVVATLTSAQPGGNSMYEDNIGDEAGKVYNWTITPYNNNGAGVTVAVSAFVGRDIPSAVAGIKVDRLGPNAAKVTWKPVTTGVNGGWTDVATMTYDVTRNPGEDKVATGLTACEWDETGVDASNTYTYTIVAKNSCGESAPAVSPSVALGPKLGVPYACDFEDDFGQWTPVDANEDENTWEKFTLTWAKATGAYINSADKAVEDWMVSNPIEFEPNTSYKVNIKGLANGADKHAVTFYLLKDEDRANPLQQIGQIDFKRVFALTDYSFTFKTGDNIGDCNVAFVDTAAKGQSYLLIDRLEIEKIVDKNLAAVSVTGNEKPIEGHTYGYTVTVTNKGTATYDSYKVSLIGNDGNELAAVTVEDAIAPGETKSHTIDYEYPLGSALTSISGKVTGAEDAVDADDSTAPLSLTILPMGSPEELAIGAGSTSTGYYHPMMLYSKYGYSQNIYAASELSVKRGRLTGIKLTYKTSTARQNIGLKIYMANTDRTDNTAGFIAEEDLTLVYDGTVNMVGGNVTTVLDLTFDKAFDYTGGNLAMVTKTSLENAGTSYMYCYQPYYTSPLSGNKVITYGASTDFTTPGAPYSRTGNSAITLMVQSGGASITGTVKDINGNPVEGVTVSLPEIHAETLTDEAGAYRFDFVPNGKYTLTASKFGYKSGESVSLTIEDEDATASLSVEKLPTFNVTGRVIAPDGSVVADADVRLEGYTSLSARTADDGSFSFADVVTAAENVVTISKPWFVGTESSFDLTADKALGDLKLGYAHFAPTSLAVDDTEGMKLGWTDPSASAELRYDAGEPATQIGISDQVGTIVIGSVFRTPMTLTDVSWYTTYEGGPHNSVNIYIYDLDENGDPTGTKLYSERAVRNVDGEWTKLTLPVAVEAPRGCMVAVNYPGFHAIGVDGDPHIFPKQQNVYAFSTNYDSEDFMYFSDETLSGNLMIRAGGIPYSAEGIHSGAEALPEFLRYNAYRSQGYDAEEWSKLNDAPLTATELADSNWADCEAGVYRYAVTTVYPDGSESARTFSPYVANDMIGSLKLTLATNSYSRDAKGTSVNILSADGLDKASAVANAEGVVEFENLWRGSYTVSSYLPGYEADDVTADLMKAKNAEISDLVLKEIIATPLNLAITGSYDDGFRFTWNESGEIFDDFEDHTAFTPASAGEVGWQYIDLDGAKTFAEQVFDFPGRTQPGSFMVFNPWMTSPDMSEQRSASIPHSGHQELACFAGYTGSDDWFISPRLTYHDDFTFRFFARGYSQTYGEVINIGYSTTDATPGAFTWLDENIDVPKQVWTEYEYSVPAAARYVAINCVSPDGFILFVDDVEITSGNGMKMNTAQSGPEVKYEVSLDGKKVTETELCSYMFDIKDEEHTASVKAIYASGESAPAEITFGVSGVNSVRNDAVSVWPNPAREYTNVRGEFSQADLYDLSGRRIRRFAGNDSRLDLSGVTPGLYLLDVTADDGKHVSVKLTVTK